MNAIYDVRSTRYEMLSRPMADYSNIKSKVAGILADVKANGDAALRRYSEKFEGLVPGSFLVPEEELRIAANCIPAELKAAILQAKANIEKFHKAQAQEPEMIETFPGVKCWRKSVPIQKVGLYIPGGSAPLFSTVLMLGVPAVLAGCREIVLCTPPKPSAAILYTACLLGITKVYQLGGAQAIAAMAYGTESIPAVYKIFGPGNRYVTCAKQLISCEGIAIDMPAGPSELAVIADSSCVPAFVAADLLSQAEHGTDSQVILVSDDAGVIAEVEREVAKQLKELPRREIAAQALANSRNILVETLEEGMELLNEYAPEHLVIACRNKVELAEKVRNAGSVFLGNYSPESAGDYASGTNHTLPTAGFAKSFSGVSLDSFLKKITFQELSEEGLKGLGGVIETMAEAEGLFAHKNAVTIRAQDSGLRVQVKFDLQALLRKNVKELVPYSSARDEFKGKANVFLDANESSEGEYNRYPDPQQKVLKQRIGEIKKISAENIFLGNGSDEAIDLLFRAFCEPGRDKVVIAGPTYGMYEVAARINDAEVRQVRLKEDFQLDVNALLEACAGAKLLFLCSPNNPSGNCLNRKDVLSVLDACEGIVVLDEAYIDFAEEAGYTKELGKYPNLVVLQTFSKAWGMAGLRLGMGFASREIIAVLNKIKAPYNLNSLSQEIVLRALGQEAVVKKRVMDTIAERRNLSVEILKLPFVEKVFPSDANFLLVKMNEAKKIYDFLAGKGIVLRDRSKVPGCEGCLRITIGTAEENRLLIETLKSYGRN